ncbi:MAG: tetratricopeptide repeat protein [Bacteroidales bacterium]|nr:tetratricopeptide repeat protein [Bacteroidales bacterium]
MNFKKFLSVIIACILWIWGFSQSDSRPLIEKGNSYYNNNDFKNAAVQYKHACQMDSLSYDAWYNFGNALYKMDKYILATEAYQKALQLTSDKTKKANILHNVGNISCNQKKYEQAIDFYKQSLLLNSKDEDTRYNLAYAQNELKKQQDKQKNDEQNKKNNDKKKPSAFAEECFKKAMELVAQAKFEEALTVMTEGKQKDKSVEIYDDFTHKLSEVVSVILLNTSK